MKKLIFVSVLLFILSSCASNYNVKSDYEKEVNFTSFQTFQIMKQKNGFPVGANPINKQRIDRAILKEMNTLGFDTAKNPDLLVSWFVKVREVEEVNVYHDYYGRWRGARWVDIDRYQEGTLIIDLIDRSKKEVVWHGVTTDRVDEFDDDAEVKINEAVKAMFEKFAKDAKLPREYALR